MLIIIINYADTRSSLQVHHPTHHFKPRWEITPTLPLFLAAAPTQEDWDSNRDSIRNTRRAHPQNPGHRRGHQEEIFQAFQAFQVPRQVAGGGRIQITGQGGTRRWTHC